MQWAWKYVPVDSRGTLSPENVFKMYRGSSYKRGNTIIMHADCPHKTSIQESIEIPRCIPETSEPMAFNGLTSGGLVVNLLYNHMKLVVEDDKAMHQEFSGSFHLCATGFPRHCHKLGYCVITE